MTTQTTKAEQNAIKFLLGRSDPVDDEWLARLRSDETTFEQGGKFCEWVSVIQQIMDGTYV